MKRKLSVLLVLAFTLIVSGCGGSTSGKSSDEKSYLSIGTTNTSSSLYAYYSGLAKSVGEQAPEIELTIMETGATNDNITRLENEQIDIGLAVMDGAYEAYSGLGEWKENSQTELRNLFTYTENALFYVVSADSGIESMDGLDGKKFNVGLRGSTTESQTTNILNLLGISPKVHSGDVSDAVNAVKDGDIIGLTKVGVGSSPDATIMDLETSLKTRLLGYSKDQVTKIQNEYPWLRTTEIPVGLYDWQTEPTTTIAMQIGNITTSNLDVDVAYKITKAAFEEKDFQEQAYQSLKNMDFTELTLQSPIPLHAGSVKYLKEIGVDLPKELIPPEFKD
ncbi:TAXI family TRAP transporter solute-binding subunit [Sporosarcina sp. FA9]|uniref:TAXI family TRAP transporter solute-binding subunit n=1 Tax=Sporosarcina sp. FA9 TaxID=3413030 RepID=UPI003F656A03